MPPGPAARAIPKAHGGSRSPATLNRPATSSQSTATNSPGSVTAAFTQTVLPESLPIGSTQYHDAVVNAVEKGKRSPQIAEAFAGCVQKVLEDAGIETVGQAETITRNPSGDRRVADGSLQCLGSAGP